MDFLMCGPQFGMSNALYTFIMYMNEIFIHHIGDHALVYMNFIIVYSSTKEQHDKDL